MQLIHHRIMFDNSRELATNQMVSSSNPVWYHDTMNDLDGCEFEFPAQTCVEESFGDFPFKLWGANMMTEDASPLLPNNLSHLSPVTRKHALEQGREEVMEMMPRMPESSYELSLKDMVHQRNACFEHKNVHLETESLIKNQMKKKKVGHVSRSGSMDTDRFLLKLMIPSCLSFKNKTRAESSSKVSPRTFCEGSEKPLQKQGWIKRIFVSRNHNISNTSRHANISNSLPGCWSFFLSKKRATSSSE